MSPSRAGKCRLRTIERYFGTCGNGCPSHESVRPHNASAFLTSLSPYARGYRSTLSLATHSSVPSNPAIDLADVFDKMPPPSLCVYLRSWYL
jgi:hypothetical protein